MYCCVQFKRELNRVEFSAKEKRKTCIFFHSLFSVLFHMYCMCVFLGTNSLNVWLVDSKNCFAYPKQISKIWAYSSHIYNEKTWSVFQVLLSICWVIAWHIYIDTNIYQISAYRYNSSFFDLIAVFNIFFFFFFYIFSFFVSLF